MPENWNGTCVLVFVGALIFVAPLPAQDRDVPQICQRSETVIPAVHLAATATSQNSNTRQWQRDETSEVKWFLSAEAMKFKILGAGGETMTERVTEPNNALAEAGDDEAPF